MSSKVTISYSLHPPKDAKAGRLGDSSKIYEFPLNPSDRGNQQLYYNSLRDAVLEAKAKIGEDLTVWRDAVGTLEDRKEPRKVKEGDDDEEEEEEGEEDS